MEYPETEGGRINLNTFFQVAVYICIALLLLTLAINFVNATGAFPIEVSTSVATEGQNTTNIFNDITGLTGGMEYIWLTVLSITGIGAIAVAVLMHSTTPIGVWLFSSVFWTSYGRMIGTINITGVFDVDPMASFLVMGTVSILFIWTAAIIGMFTGSG